MPKAIAPTIGTRQMFCVRTMPLLRYAPWRFSKIARTPLIVGMIVTAYLQCQGDISHTPLEWAQNTPEFCVFYSRRRLEAAHRPPLCKKIAPLSGQGLPI